MRRRLSRKKKLFTSKCRKIIEFYESPCEIFVLEEETFLKVLQCWEIPKISVVNKCR
jgi:hypothetical protein